MAVPQAFKFDTRIKPNRFENCHCWAWALACTWKTHVHNSTSEFGFAVLPYQQGIYKQSCEKRSSPPPHSLNHITEYGGRLATPLDQALHVQYAHARQAQQKSTDNVECGATGCLSGSALV